MTRGKQLLVAFWASCQFWIELRQPNKSIPIDKPCLVIYLEGNAEFLLKSQIVSKSLFPLMFSYCVTSPFVLLVREEQKPNNGCLESLSTANII